MSFTSIEKQADRFYENSGLPTKVCRALALFTNNKNKKQMAIIAEKHLLTEDQNESLKDRGLTILDVVEGTLSVPDMVFAKGLMDEWNDLLGEKVFSF